MDFNVQFIESRKMLLDSAWSTIQVLYYLLSHYFFVDIPYQWIDD